MSETDDLQRFLTPQEIAEINELLDPTFWPERVKTLFGNYLWRDFSRPQTELWNWATSLGKNPDAFIAIWPRGRGKSTHAETIAAYWCARGVRRYIAYVSSTQEQADKHILTIANMLESDAVVAQYPLVGRPKVGKNGGRRWNRSIITTANGRTVEAVGLNKAVRGGRIDWARLDGIILDDVDEPHDTQNTTNKKREIITTSILPARAHGCAVVFAQSLIMRGSLAHELSIPVGVTKHGVAGASYLTNRIISGPYEAVRGLEYELIDHAWRITKGESLWAGVTIEDCEQELNTVGPVAYETEYQHNITADNPNALLTTHEIELTRVTGHPDLDVVVVGVDPSGGAGQCGIITVGKARINGEWHTYTIRDNSTDYGTGAAEWGERVLRSYYMDKADAIIVESNFGGDMATKNYRRHRQCYHERG